MDSLRSLDDAGQDRRSSEVCRGISKEKEVLPQGLASDGAAEAFSKEKEVLPHADILPQTELFRCFGWKKRFCLMQIFCLRRSFSGVLDGKRGFASRPCLGRSVGGEPVRQNEESL